MNKLIPLCLVLGLSACAPSTWVRNSDPGFQKVGTPESFEVDKQECIWKAQAYAGNDPFSWPSMVAQCLRAKGWVPAGKQAQAPAIKSVGEGLSTSIAKGVR